MFQMLFRDRPGFTVAELIIASALVSVLMGAILITFVIGLKIWGSEMPRTAFIKDISYSAQVMSEDLREAVLFTAAADDTVSFRQDINGDGIPDTDIQYSVSGGVLKRIKDNNSAAPSYLARNVQSFAFKYYSPYDNINPMGVVNRAQIKVVEIDLVLTNGSESMQFTTRVRPRGI